MTDEDILSAISKVEDLGGMTGNERLYATGLIEEFESAKLNDKEKAKRTFRWLKFDETSITKIIL